MRGDVFGSVIAVRKRLLELDFLEEADAEDLQDCVEIAFDAQSLLRDGNQHVDGDGDPDLRAHGVGASAVERLDAEVLLDPLEEDLDLPARAVQLGDGQGREVEVIGQKGVAPSRLGILVADPAELLRIVLGGGLDGEDDGLVADESRAAVDRV